MPEADLADRIDVASVYPAVLAEGGAQVEPIATPIAATQESVRMGATFGTPSADLPAHVREWVPSTDQGKDWALLHGPTHE